MEFNMELDKQEREMRERESRKRTHSIAFDKFNITMERISENTPFPSFSKPWVAGCFSLDQDRKYLEGPQFMKFCHVPPPSATIKFDLNRQASQIRNMYSEMSEEEAHQQTSELLHLLFWARKHKERFKRWRPNFVFYRGLMTRLLGTPYENQEGWKIAAMMKTKTIYLRELDTPESVANRQKFNSKPFLRKTAEWGRTFEYFLLSDEPDSKPTPEQVKKEECNIVFRTKLGSHDLLYAAEVDGVLLKEGQGNPKKQPELLQSSELVEIKTTRQFPNGEMPFKFRKFNLRKWWCQCFTAGISHVVVGLRDDDGLVEEVKSYPVDQLPKMGADWSSTVCFNFLDQFLSEIKRIIGDDVTSVFILEFRPQKHLTGVISISVTVEKNSDKYLQSII